MSSINNQVSQYNNINNIGAGNNNQVSDVRMNRQVPSVSPKLSIGGRSNESAMPKNFIIPEGERTGELGKTFDEKILKQIGAVECSTCASRTYQDGSNDPGVSFKAATHLSPEQAATAVRGHEQEHVVNEQANAKKEGREVVSQSVQIFTAICPECGTTYVSGGVTKTTTAGPSNPYGQLNDANAEGNLLDLSL